LANGDALNREAHDMAINRPNGGGRRGAIRNRTQFRLPNGHYAKVNRATGQIIAVKADRKPYKGVVIAAAPARLPRRAGTRVNLPPLMARRSWQSRMPATARHLVTLPMAEAPTPKGLAA
jgi:hypothetical protein